MFRLHQTLTRLTPRGRVALAAALALVLGVVAATLLPSGEGPGEEPDGAVRPATEQSAPTYVARESAPGPGTISAQDREAIEDLLADSPASVSARRPASLAHDLARCTTFEGQQYCLGVGWTDADPELVQARAAAAKPQNRRPSSVETTGDLSTADLLAQRAARPAAERLAAERAELEAAARAVAKVVLLRHQILGDPLPAGFLERHPEARAPAARTSTTSTSAAPKGLKDYPRRSKILRGKQVRAQRRTYWCGPTTMQAIAWGWHGKRRTQKHWAGKLGTTSSGSAISEIVRVVNSATGYDQERYAGKYIVLDISDWSFKKWLLLQMRHIEDYRAPVVLHPILLKRFFPYLDDDASGHFQVGRGYDKNGKKPARLGYFEPWNQQRFDPSEPFISRVQWRNAYQSYRANQAHPHQNIGV
ncbi:C39 family peptidase [Nocardioides sp.]|uniref:C39 family peptidase n=1 Tax=Nocardioides sp. TaxID=35761 RepID=UPI002ED06C03